MVSLMARWQLAPVRHALKNRVVRQALLHLLRPSRLPEEKCGPILFREALLRRHHICSGVVMEGLPKHHLLKLLDLSAELAADSRLLRWILILLFRIRMVLLRVSQFGLSP